MLKKLDCPATPELACKLAGSSLYLIDSVSGDSEFTKPLSVPDGFLGSALPVPHPRNGTLYLKLRDNPQIVNPIALTAQAIPQAPAESDRAAARQSALSTEPTAAPSVSPAPSPPPNTPPSTGAPTPPAPAAPANAPQTAAGSSHVTGDQ
jgi:hypothetical protein